MNKELKAWLIAEHKKALLEGVRLGAEHERKKIVERIENQICFDALADAYGRCSNHGGKCYELRELIKSLGLSVNSDGLIDFDEDGSVTYLIKTENKENN